MKKIGILISLLSLIKLIIHLIGNGNYGFHRDELLHLSVSEHLAWGYYEFPPMIAVIGKLSYLLFDYDLHGMRIFATLAGVGVLIFCCLITIELGGRFKAVLFAGLCILTYIPFYRNHTLFQPVAFDQLLWVMAFYFLIKFIKSNRNKHLISLAIVLGLGLLTKYTILVFIFGSFIGLLFYQKGQLFKQSRVYIAASLIFLLALPNILWQWANDWPLVRHLESLSAKQLEDIGPWDFILDQVEIVPLFLIFSLGFVGLFISEKLKPYRCIGIASLVMFFSMWLLKGKSYYIFALYPMLFSAGAVYIESWFKSRAFWMYPLIATVTIPMIFFIPEGAPILPIDKYVAYMNLNEDNGRVKLTNDFADMFGWSEQVAVVDSIYRSLPEQYSNDVVLWAENYGEAGALKILGKNYNLPNPISRHGSFWSWGPGNTEAKVWISIGNETDAVQSVFKEVTLVKRLNHRYAIDEEQNIPIYICRKPRVNINEWWQDYEARIFE